MSDLKPMTYRTQVYVGDSVHVFEESIVKIEYQKLCVYSDGFLMASFSEWDYHVCSPFRETLSTEIAEGVWELKEKREAESKEITALSELGFNIGTADVSQFENCNKCGNRYYKPYYTECQVCEKAGRT